MCIKTPKLVCEQPGFHIIFPSPAHGWETPWIPFHRHSWEEPSGSYRNRADVARRVWVISPDSESCVFPGLPPASLVRWMGPMGKSLSRTGPWFGEERGGAGLQPVVSLGGAVGSCLQKVGALECSGTPEGRRRSCGVPRSHSAQGIPSHQYVVRLLYHTLRKPRVRGKEDKSVCRAFFAGCFSVIIRLLLMVKKASCGHRPHVVESVD